MKRKTTINWWGISAFLGGVFAFSIVGMSLPPTIARINYGNIEYGIFASYAISMILFWMLIKDIRLVK